MLYSQLQLLSQTKARVHVGLLGTGRTGYLSSVMLDYLILDEGRGPQTIIPFSHIQTVDVIEVVEDPGETEEVE